ncbi:MAG TPA: hypothetical protein VGI06_12400 [Acidimicrobiales bacterium]
MIGNVYAIRPQPPVQEDTRWFDAGNLRLGIEYREIDHDSLVRTYEQDEAQLAELNANWPETDVQDEGLSLHVVGAADGHEYLRFDVFDTSPHYHYNHPGEPIVNNVIDFDRSAHGDMLAWALERLRTRLGEMLTEAGGDDLVAGLDPAAVSGALDQVQALADAQRRARRRAAPTSTGG